MLFWSCAWLTSEVVISERFVSGMLYLISFKEPQESFFFFKISLVKMFLYLSAKSIGELHSIIFEIGTPSMPLHSLFLPMHILYSEFFYFFFLLWLSCFRVYTYNMQLCFVHTCLPRRRRNLETYKWWLYFVQYLVHFLCGGVFCTYVYTT